MTARTHTLLVAASIAVVMLFGTNAAAQQTTTHKSNSTEPSLLSKPEKKLTLSFSPVHLLFPFAEVTGEYAVSHTFGVAGIAGVGGSNGAYMLGVGAQAIWYLTGDFQNGLQVGGEVLYNEVGASAGGNSVALVEGLGAAPFLGYKASARSGLTGIVQAGPQFIAASNAFGDSGTGVGIMLNLNVGWTF